MIILSDKFTTRSLRESPWGIDICKLLAAAIHSADAGTSIKNKVSIEAGILHIPNLSVNLNRYRRIFVFGAGKAAVPMAEAVVEILESRVTSGLVITKDGYGGNKENLDKHHIEVILAAHPFPDQRSMAASSKLVKRAHNLCIDDLVICVISGGGSSLLLQPAPGVSLRDIQGTVSSLIIRGAAIDEMNTVRKHLDELKGGGLAKVFFPATVITLILSDVVGDKLDVVASGPTAADPTTFKDARQVLEKCQVWHQIPASVRAHILGGIEGQIHETVKPGDPVLDKVQNILVGNNIQTAQAAVKAAQELGFRAEMLPDPLKGEASHIGQTMIDQVKGLLVPLKNSQQPTCFIAGGETTVTVTGNGTGGRNQELALGAVKSLSSASQMVLVSLATDGGDGPTDAAGAVATNLTYSFGIEKGLDPADYLLRNDSYNYFDRLDDLIKIGPTMTNVNDLLFIFCG